ncbi:hypothetical protein PTI98_011344 [Pleurotus ostreatus]|nr:hypothetical protein PTI98_011344 [Pleurotus ostreatus]
MSLHTHNIPGTPGAVSPSLRSFPTTRSVDELPLFHFEYHGRVDSRFLGSTKFLCVVIFGLVVLALATAAATAHAFRLAALITWVTLMPMFCCVVIIGKLVNSRQLRSAHWRA